MLSLPVKTRAYAAGNFWAETHILDTLEALDVHPVLGITALNWVHEDIESNPAQLMTLIEEMQEASV